MKCTDSNIIMGFGASRHKGEIVPAASLRKRMMLRSETNTAACNACAVKGTMYVCWRMLCDEWAYEMHRELPPAQECTLCEKISDAERRACVHTYYFASQLLGVDCGERVFQMYLDLPGLVAGFAPRTNESFIEWELPYRKKGTLCNVLAICWGMIVPRLGIYILKSGIPLLPWQPDRDILSVIFVVLCGGFLILPYFGRQEHADDRVVFYLAAKIIGWGLVCIMHLIRSQCDGSWWCSLCAYG